METLTNLLVWIALAGPYLFIITRPPVEKWANTLSEPLGTIFGFISLLWIFIVSPFVAAYIANPYRSGYTPAEYCAQPTNHLSTAQGVNVCLNIVDSVLSTKAESSYDYDESAATAKCLAYGFQEPECSDDAYFIIHNVKSQ